MSDLNVIIAADIFGTSPEFKTLCQQISLAEAGSTAINYHVVGPYQTQPNSFSSEKSAYQYFIEHAGVEAYSEKLLSIIEASSGLKLLIGFSVGGSAIWRLAPKLASSGVISTICFYSSQIRHMSEIETTVPCQLVLPNSEEHFSVNELKAKMENKQQVNVEQCCYQHGFLNKLSNNYNQSGAKQYTRNIQKFITKACLLL